jgi:hypothetical protein
MNGDCVKNSFALTQTIKEVAMKIIITGGTGMLGRALTRIHRSWR